MKRSPKCQEGIHGRRETKGYTLSVSRGEVPRKPPGYFTCGHGCKCYCHEAPRTPLMLDLAAALGIKFGEEGGDRYGEDESEGSSEE